MGGRGGERRPAAKERAVAGASVASHAVMRGQQAWLYPLTSPSSHLLHDGDLYRAGAGLGLGAVALSAGALQGWGRGASRLFKAANTGTGQEGLGALLRSAAFPGPGRHQCKAWPAIWLRQLGRQVPRACRSPQCRRRGRRRRLRCTRCRWRRAGCLLCPCRCLRARHAPRRTCR